MSKEEDLADVLLGEFSGGLLLLSATMLPGDYVGQGASHHGHDFITTCPSASYPGDFDRGLVEDAVENKLETMKTDVVLWVSGVLDELCIS